MAKYKRCRIRHNRSWKRSIRRYGTPEVKTLGQFIRYIKRKCTPIKVVDGNYIIYVSKSQIDMIRQDAAIADKVSFSS